MALLPAGVGAAHGAAAPDEGIQLALYTETQLGALHLLSP